MEMVAEAHMGRVTGDKSRFNKKRRQKLARRVEMRALAKTMAAKAPKPAPAASSPRS
jgi:hypothetical protein